MLLPNEPLINLLGDRTAKAFAKHLQVNTASDLLQHFPRRYSCRGELTPIAEIPIGETVSVVADVLDVRERHMRGRAGSILEVRVTDGDGILSATFFNQAWRAKDLKPGSRGLFAGKISSYQGKLQLAHPDYELFPEEISDQDAKAWADLPIPIYSATSKVTTWMIQKAVGVVLDVIGPIAEELPDEVVATNNLLPLDQAIRQVHQPDNQGQWQAARDTLRFHEAFLLQATLVTRRRLNASVQATPRVAGGILGDFDKSLPFTLTRGQVEVGNQLQTDLEQAHPMHRMLQGEVGSGKTLVAVRAMLAVAQSGGQSALLAPTEVLAAQHFRSIRKTLGDDLADKLGLTLLTGQMSTAEHKRALLQVISGKALIVVGTHALMSAKVEFFDLGFIVVDEQHRFGVEQREALRLKGKLPPHVLTMTATPIPRTLAVSVFGDLDISTLDELPAGRQPITSHVVRQAQSALVARTWTRIREEVDAGHQAFVVCSRIDDQDEPDDDIDEAGEEQLDEPKTKPATVVGMMTALASVDALSGLRIEALHGRMSSEEKDSVMNRFAAREIDILVSTTVIEVGVDVP
ncbi:MAG: ATP-dependent DNA helicase RecG, partial [Micrococcales bacterium]